MATPMQQVPTMFSVVKTMSPDEAKRTLERYNTHNRMFRPGAVRTLTNVIKRGEWKLTHQGIAFDEDGVLLDGQHRLAAIAAAGTTVPITISYNVPRDSFTVIDTHQRRSVADATGLSKDACAVGSVFVRVGTGKHTSRALSIRAAEAFKDDTAELLSYCNSKRRGCSSALQAGVIAKAIESGDKEFCYGSYRTFVLEQFDRMSALQQSYYRQSNSRGQTVDHKIDPVTEAFARATIAFDPKNAALTRVMMRNFEPTRQLALDCLQARGVL